MRPLLGRICCFNPFGPIFNKELLVASRRKRTYLLRVGYLLVLLLTLLATFAGSEEAAGGAAARAQQQAFMGCIFFCCFSIFCVIAMGLIGPVLTATSINSEQLHKTLHVLLMTPITALQIVLGKLFSRLLVAMSLIGLSLPVLALVRLLGGVELEQMLGVVCVCVSFALSSAAIGLFFSTLLARAYAVILISYALMLFLYLFLPMMLAIAMHPGPSWLSVWCASNPVVCVTMLSQPVRMTFFSVTWWPAVVVQLLLAALLVLTSSAMLRRISRGSNGEASGAQNQPRTARHRPSSPLPARGSRQDGFIASMEEGCGDDRPSNAVAARRPPPLTGLPPRAFVTRGAAAPPGSVVSDNPILWRELRRPLLKKRWQRWTAVIVIVLLLGLSYFALTIHDELFDAGNQVGFAATFCGFGWLLTCVLSATAIAQEKESDTWTLLLTTPITGDAVVWGKLVGLGRRLVWPMVVVLVHFALFVLAGVIHWAVLLLVIWVVFTFNFVWIATGLFLSLRLKKVTTAVIINLLLAIFIYAGGFLILRVIILWTKSAHHLEDQVGWAVPYMYLGAGMDGLERMARGDLNQTFFGPTRVNGLQFFIIVTAVGTLYLMTAAGILFHTAKRFDRIVGRAREGPAAHPCESEPLLNAALD